MANDPRRITLVAFNRRDGARSWQTSRAARSRLIFVPKVLLHQAVKIEEDVERVIIDRSATASEYLALLCALPLQFIADVLFIEDDDNGYLSSIGRGGDRVLYALGAEDLRFYLEINELIEHGYLARQTA